MKLKFWRGCSFKNQYYPGMSMGVYYCGRIKKTIFEDEDYKKQRSPSQFGTV